MLPKIQQAYDKDFYAWTMRQAKLIRQGKLSELTTVDLEHIAEEIESMGTNDESQLINRLAILLAHLLKWVYQPNRRGNSWKYTIKEQRFKISALLKRSPSLKYGFEQRFDQAYQLAMIKALKQTNMDEEIFPKDCPFTLDQTLNQDFFPE